MASAGDRVVAPIKMRFPSSLYHAPGGGCSRSTAMRDYRTRIEAVIMGRSPLLFGDLRLPRGAPSEGGAEGLGRRGHRGLGAGELEEVGTLGGLHDGPQHARAGRGL